MIAQRAKDQETAARTARNVFPIAGEGGVFPMAGEGGVFPMAGEGGVFPMADLLAQRMQIHEKTARMLRSMIRRQCADQTSTSKSGGEKWTETKLENAR